METNLHIVIDDKILCEQLQFIDYLSDENSIIYASKSYLTRIIRYINRGDDYEQEKAERHVNLINKIQHEAYAFECKTKDVMVDYPFYFAKKLAAIHPEDEVVFVISDLFKDYRVKGIDNLSVMSFYAFVNRFS